MNDFAKYLKQVCTRKGGGINGRCNQPTWWKGKEDAYARLLAVTSFLPEESTMQQRLYHIWNATYTVPVCKHCGSPVSFQGNTLSYSIFCSPKCNATANKKVGKENPFARHSVKEKIKESNLKRYGVDNFAKSPNFKEKYNASMTPAKLDDAAKKRKATCNAVYGVDHPFASSQVQKKIKETMQTRYGVSSPLQSATILQRQQETCTERFGASSFQQKDFSKELLHNIDNKDWYLQQLQTTSIREIALLHSISYSALCTKMRSTGIDLARYSSFEQEIANFVSKLGVDVVRSDRTLISPKELDIVVPSKRIAIECNGVYWHSERKGKTKDYHLKKTITALESGFQVLHIFQTEWDNQRPIVESILQQRISGPQKILHARKLNISVVGKQLERQFLTDNHLQGYTSSKVCLGLFDGDVLIQMMSFGKPRFNKKFEWELTRLATLCGYVVSGGANKLFNSFVSNYSPKTIVSYCDRRWFSGEVYHRLGFSLSHISAPNYFYIQPDGTLVSRLKYQKHRLLKMFPDSDPTWTEHQIAESVGLNRIWDCGNFVFHWTSTGQ